MIRTALLFGVGVVATVVGFAKPIEPLIEVGVALIVVAWLSKAKPSP